MKTNNFIPKSLYALPIVFLGFFSLPALAGSSLGQSADSKETAPIESSRWKLGDPLSLADGLIVFDVEERLRYEFRNNTFDFNSGNNPVTEGSFLLQRFRFGLIIEPVPWLRAYGQLQSSIEVGRRPNDPGVFGAEGDDYIDLYQGWLEFANYSEFPLGLKIGRQLFNYGDQRLVGSFDWNNLGRTFDAARLRYQTEKLWVEAFASSVVVVEKSTFNTSDLFDWDGSGREQVFSGIYLSTQHVPAHTLDLYAFMLDQANGNVSNFGPLLNVPPAGSQGGNPNARTDFVTLGTRFQNDPAQMKGLVYDGEFTFQVGKLAGLDLTAFASHIGLGYQSSLPWEPRLYLQYNYASGDSNRSDNKTTTFQNLFPTNHKFYGYMDLFSWQNIQNPSVTLSVKPHKTLTLSADLQMFWLATTNDAWYRANGLARARPITPSANPYVGTELDFTATWRPAKWVSVHGGYSLFLPGAYVRDTGPASPANFVYVQTSFTF